MYAQLYPLSRPIRAQQPRRNICSGRNPKETTVSDVEIVNNPFDDLSFIGNVTRRSDAPTNPASVTLTYCCWAFMASAIFSFTVSRLKLEPFCMGG